MSISSVVNMVWIAQLLNRFQEWYQIRFVTPRTLLSPSHTTCHWVLQSQSSPSKANNGHPFIIYNSSEVPDPWPCQTCLAMSREASFVQQQLVSTPVEPFFCKLEVIFTKFRDQFFDRPKVHHSRLKTWGFHTFTSRRIVGNFSGWLTKACGTSFLWSLAS